MGIFDPDEVITGYSIKQAVEDGVLVEIFKNRWGRLSGGKPIVATMNVFEQISRRSLWNWNGFVGWKQQVFPKRSSEERLFSTEVNGMVVWVMEEERLFSTEVNGMVVWVMEDRVCVTIMYPHDY